LSHCSLPGISDSHDAAVTTRSFLAVLFLASVADAACFFGDTTWTGTLFDRPVTCCARQNLTPEGLAAYIGDVTLWCNRGPRRSLHASLYIDPVTWKPTTIRPGGGGGFAVVCRQGPHLHRPTFRKLKFGVRLRQPPFRYCCQITGVSSVTGAFMYSGRYYYGDIISLEGTVDCRHRKGIPFGLAASQ
jgi:hypothetical protein